MNNKVQILKIPKPKFDIVTKSYIVTMFYNKIVYNTVGIVNNFFLH